MCSTEAPDLPGSPVGATYTVPSGLTNWGESVFATHITLLRSDNPLFFNVMKERHSPVVRGGVRS